MAEKSSLMSLESRKILLGVSGGIAAYKSVFLLRLLRKAGAEVKVIFTPMANAFVGKLTFSALSGNEVYEDFYDERSGRWFSHVELGRWAEVMVIAPATADIIAKMSAGIADNLLLTTYLSTTAKVFVAPAMDLQMSHHPSVEANLKILRERGVEIIEWGEGELASGLRGRGRMAEPEEIFKRLEEYFISSNALKGYKVLVTAGPTYEMLDPVRFIGNFSSGKMGYAIAEEFARQGAEVFLISGPTHLEVHNENIHLISVLSARQMYEKALEIYPQVDIGVLAAAVADYRPEKMAENKLKKLSDKISLILVKNPDIAAELGKMKREKQILVGFALETENEYAHAVEKLRKKNFDFIVLNSLRDQGAGFGYDTNKVKFIFRDGKIKNFELKKKTEVARDIVEQIKEFL